METQDNKVETSTTAVEEGQKVTSTDNEGQKKETQPQNEKTQPFKVYNTQVDFDNEAAKMKGSIEHDFFKKLGIKDKSDLEKVKKAYEASLTQEEKNQKAFEELENLKKQASRKDFIINALAKKSNEAIEDVEKQVTMAESLVSAGNYTSFDEAFNYVRGLTAVVEQKPSIPQGKEISQPDTKTEPTTPNPFKTDNLTEQTKLFKENPELARKLAKEVGIIL